jgi:hypothetical protein
MTKTRQTTQRHTATSKALVTILPPVKAEHNKLMTDDEAKAAMRRIIAKDPKRYAALKRVGALADKITAERVTAAKKGGK